VRSLRAHELFFSTTNERGVITSGNDAFSRVSGYPLDEMIIKAHDIVRHPSIRR
jgi:PAS domain-containing protein